MHKTCIALLLSVVFLAACDNKPATPSASIPLTSSTTSTPSATPMAAPPSSGEVQKKLQEAAGSGATNCGDVKSQTADELTKASECAMQAAKGKKAFLVSYGMPGMIVGVAGNSGGKLFTVQSEEVAGKTASPKVQDCPAELRVAQSGRVTCFPVGSMGAMGAGSPHAGQGGMPAPSAGTPNPHKTTAAPAKSH